MALFPLVHCELFVATDSFGLLPIASAGGSEVLRRFWGHRASRHQVAGDAGWGHLLSGSEGNGVRSRFERAFARTRSRSIWTSNWVRCIPGGDRRRDRGWGSRSPFPLFNVNPISTNPTAISFLQLGPNSAIPIPHWDPCCNINSPLGPQYQ